ncbi:hypothetical protein PMAYCL1PPCAC_19071, partial [Pristionchus mayeri]
AGPITQAAVIGGIYAVIDLIVGLFTQWCCSPAPAESQVLPVYEPLIETEEPAQLGYDHELYGPVAYEDGGYAGPQWFDD